MQKYHGLTEEPVECHADGCDYHFHYYLASDVDARIADLEKAHARYEHVRRLNPHQFRELWERNLRGEGPFDALVDSAISLMVPGVGT